MKAIYLVQNNYEGVCEGYTNTYEQAYTIVEKILRDRYGWEEKDIREEMNAIRIEGYGEFFDIEEVYEII